MPKPVSLVPSTFFGAGNPALSGVHRITLFDFCIYGKSEAVGGEEDAPKRQGEKKEKKVRTFCEVGFTPVGGGEEQVTRYSVGLADMFKPGSDAATYAEGDGDKGPRGKFLLMEDGRNVSLDEKYDKFPTFIRSLEAAGVPAEVFQNFAEKGSDVFLGIEVDLFPLIEEYEHEGKKFKRQPVNLAVKDSYKPPSGKSGNAGKGGKATAAAKSAPAAAASQASNEDADAAAMTVLDLLVLKINELLQAGTAVTRISAAGLVPPLNTEAGGLLKGINVLSVVNSVKGAGPGSDKYSAQFQEKLGALEIPVQINDDGSLSF